MCREEELAKLKEKSTDNIATVPEARINECLKRQSSR